MTSPFVNALVSAALSGPWANHSPVESFEPPSSYLCNYRGTIEVNLYSTASVDGICRNLGVTFPSDGCTQVFGSPQEPSSRCTMHLPKGTMPNSTIFRHELAHCCGWPADHPFE